MALCPLSKIIFKKIKIKLKEYFFNTPKCAKNANTYALILN